MLSKIADFDTRGSRNALTDWWHSLAPLLCTT